MGRAMLIICSAALISLGIIGISTAEMGQLLSETNVNYAYEITVKNSSHTGIQIAMQEISKDSSWIEDYGPGNEDSPQIEKPVDELLVYAEYLNDDWDENDYFDSDSIRIVSKAKINHGTKTTKANVSSVYLMGKFADMVPDFEGALQLPTNIGNFNVDGGAHEINGIPEDATCSENKPPITAQSQETKDKVTSEDIKNKDGDISDDEVVVDEDLDYEPTDELIERLEQYATIVDSDFGDNLGTADEPGVFFIDGEVKLSGSQKEGFGILVIKAGSGMEMDNPELSVAGNFTFNGLVIFENAKVFDGHGTPTINGSVLVGNTGDYEEEPIDIDLGGNIEINYECSGERYAKIAANNLVDQNKYNRVVSFEETGVE